MMNGREKFVLIFQIAGSMMLLMALTIGMLITADPEIVTSFGVVSGAFFLGAISVKMETLK